MWFPDNTPMLRSFKSRPLGPRLREALGSIRACRSCLYPGLRPRQRPASGERAREPSLLAPKVRVQPLLEIYTAEVRFTRKIIFLQKIYSLKSRDLSYRLMGFGVWSARLALRITWLNKRWDELWSQKPVAA